MRLQLLILSRMRHKSRVVLSKGAGEGFNGVRIAVWHVWLGKCSTVWGCCIRRVVVVYKIGNMMQAEETYSVSIPAHTLTIPQGISEPFTSPFRIQSV